MALVDWAEDVILNPDTIESSIPFETFAPFCDLTAHAPSVEL